MIAESGSSGDLNCSARGNFDGRVNDVLFPIALAGGDVAGQRVTGKGRGGDVVSPANTRFEHATAPRVDAASEAESLDLASASVAADAAQLDVNDARGSELQSSLRIAEVADGLVKANRSLQMSLELGVIGDVVPPERLLHHQQAKFIEALEMVHIRKRVGRIGIDGQKNTGMRAADGAHNSDVDARLDLEFDTLIAGAKLDGDFFENHFRSSLQPQGDTAFQFRLRAAEQLGEGALLLLGFHVPEGIFDSCAGRLVTANAGKNLRDFGGGANFPAKNQRNEKSTNDQPRRVRGFGVEERAFPGGHFGPAGQTVG